ncbi:DUF58 domain-containing protein [Salinithrix halophila]|uniref:DUF58 domain-containing protein n=1 Tax=Salinithrix halophila TaxID=1485204 RepID=A0ABV8JKX9_9BACL
MTSSGKSSVRSPSRGSTWLPTTRLLGWFATGLAVTALGWGLGYTILFTSTYYLLLTAVVLREGRKLYHCQPLILTRRSDVFFELGEDVPVELSAAHPGGIPLTLTLRDDYPNGFTTDRREMRLKLPPNGVAAVTYRARPHQRGCHRFGDIHVRIGGPLGLVLLQQVIHAAEEKQVYPLLTEVRKVRSGVYRKLAAEGSHSSKGWGRSTAFSHIREYVPGDDPRWINWNATARRGKLVANVYQPEHGQQAVILIDCGRVMGVRDGEKTRLDRAIEGALAFAAMALERGDQVSLLAFSDRIKRWVPPGKGTRQLKRLIEAVYDLEADFVESAYQMAMETLVLHHKRRALVSLFTDAGNLIFAEELIRQLAVLRRRHLVLTVTIQDPLSKKEAGRFPEDEPDVYRKAVAEVISEERTERLTQLKRRGVVVLDVPPGQLAGSVIHTYIDIKNRSLL